MGRIVRRAKDLFFVQVFVVILRDIGSNSIIYMWNDGGLLVEFLGNLSLKIKLLCYRY